ncbi:MAG: T9SS type A sorting domain-containing protein [Saprospiraceae bacterium]|nr:T9SS type A sorting domain-containing protein [Saprospiraceae bacterium]
MKNILFPLGILIFIANSLYAQQWSFDNSFGNAGKTSFNLAKSADFLFDIAVTDEGLIYAIGEIDKGNLIGNGPTKVLLRFNTEGKIDQNLGSKGYIKLTNLIEVNAIEVQQDGKILIAGKESSTIGYVLYRYLPSGALDYTFGYLGKAVHPNLDGSELHSIILMEDGKILGVGQSSSSLFSSRFLMVKFNSNGTLDSSFGVGGVVNNPNAQGIAYDIALQEDERIVAVGYNKNGKMNAIRFNANGILDTSFGNNGVMNYEGGEGKVVLVQDDGRIIIGGTTGSFDTSETRLFRIMPDGALDETFTPGSLISSLQNYLEGFYFRNDYGLIQLGDGRIIQSFFREIDGRSDIILMMHNADGTIYEGFGNKGRLVIDLSRVFERGSTLQMDQNGQIIVSGISDMDVVLLRLDTIGHIDTQYGGKFNLADGDENDVAMALYPDGKILVKATNTAADIYDRDLVVCCLDQTGALDSTFGGTGVLLSGHNSDLRRANAIAVTTDGKAILAGHNYNNYLVEVTKLLTNGMVDSSFGDEGYVRFPFIDTITSNAVTSMMIQNDGKILIGGRGGDLVDLFALARLLPDGSLDLEFGKNGVVTTAFSEEEGTLTCLAIDDQGNIFAGGYQELPGTDEQFAIVKYLTDGSLDTNFGTDGIATFLVEKSCSIEDILIQEDGKIMAIGNVQNSTGKNLVGALRIEGTDGTPDIMFGDNGWLFSDFGMEEGGATSGVLQHDGKIIMAGSAGNNENFYFSLGRWQKNGEIDATFGVNGFITFNIGSSQGGCQDIVIQPDNNILVAGVTINNTDIGSDIALIRILNTLEVGIVDVVNRDEVLLVYPNPISDHVNFQFELNKSDYCEIALYNINGDLIQTLERNRSFPSGINTVSIFPDINLPSGGYYLRLNCGNNHRTGVMVFKN